MSEQCTVLYVDDEYLNLELFKINLKGKFNIITADSGFKGMDMLKLHPEINIIISDMKMPQMNGLEFIVAAKKIRPKIKCFILTGYDIIPEIAEAIEKKEVIKYFQKPFDIDEIVGSIFEAGCF